MASQAMKKFTQLLGSISLFSFLFTYYSLNFSFSEFPFQLISHAMDKNYVFLICNGIFLVLLANTSSEEKEEEEEEEEEEKAEEDEFLNEFQEGELSLCVDGRALYLETPKEEIHVQCIENSNMTLVKYKQDETTSEFSQILDEECPRTYDIVEANNCEENEMDFEDDFFIEEEEEEVEDIDEPLNELSTEELNKKFEEFIRKMREEIRIEARQQLVLVK